MNEQKTVLAIETSARVGGVAVVAADGRILAEEMLSDGMKHGRLLIPAIDKVLSIAGIALSELGAIAVSIGPGSYTGTRVGVIAGKTLAFAAGIKVIPVSSLEALSLASCCRGGIVVPLQYARNDELYTAVYEVTESSETRTLVEDVALEPELVLQMAGAYSVDCFIGSGLDKFAAEFAEFKESGIVCENSVQGAPARCVGRVALQHYNSAINPLGVEPVYMRRDSSPCTFERFQK